MSTFVVYDAEVEITGTTKDDTWRSYDISSFMADSTARAVILRQKSVSASTGTFQTARESGSSETTETLCRQGSYWTTVVSLTAAGPTIELKQSVTSHQARIIGEIHDHVGIHQYPISLPLTSFATFLEHTVTPLAGDSVGDIRQVIVKYRTTHAQIFADYMVRKIGSGRGVELLVDETGEGWIIADVDSDGKYEFSGGGSGGTPWIAFWEVGYILKTGKVFTIPVPVDEDVPAVGNSFVPLDLSGSFPSNTINIGVRWVNTGTRHHSYVSNTGGSGHGNRILADTQSVALPVQIDENLLCQYVLRNAVVDLYVEWYELLQTEAADCKAHMGPSTGGKSHLGPSSHAASGMGPSSGAAAAIGPGTDGKAMFNDSCKATAGFGVN